MAKFKNKSFMLNFTEYTEKVAGEGIEIPDDQLPGKGTEVDLVRCEKIGLELTDDQKKKLPTAEKTEVKAKIETPITLNDGK